MRVGNVGSISPSGELAAFAVATAVVVSLSIYLTGDLEGDRESTVGSDEVLMVSSWKGLDPDDDGDIEIENGEMILSFSRGSFPLRGNVALSLSVKGDEDIILLLRDGKPLEEETEHSICSEVHDIPVLADKGEETHPARLSVFLWRDAE
ncbi:MAG: hypothetical protein R6V01_06660 [Thermoplasmatota archaeon]